MREKIMEILSGLRPECDFENSDNYIEDGLLDSMDIVALVDSVEEEYGITIPGTAISAKYFGNLDSIVELIEKYK
jgi:acyl carrier protein